MSGPNRDEPLLFEIGWEVARKVGGIYTVLRSKADITVEQWGDRYCLIGIYSPDSAATEFEPLEPGPVLGPTVEALRQQGVGVHFGRWLVKGHPRVLLFDLGTCYHKMDDWKYALWEDLGIGTPNDDPETNDAVIFGNLVAQFLAELGWRMPGRPIIAHFHEWLAAVGLPLIRYRNLPVATVFTTHATLLGRYLCASQIDFYNQLPWLEPDIESGNRNIYHRYCIERAAAHGAHVFTTVSEITAYEAEHLLKRRPDVVLPNGLKLDNFTVLHEFQNLHSEYKQRIHTFTQGHFYGHYDFDLENTLYFFTSGRYEFHNKGVDMYIEALHRLNQRLRRESSHITVVAFIIMPAMTNNFCVEALKGHFMIEELRETCDTIQREIGKRIFEATARGHLPDPEKLIADQEWVMLKRRIYSLNRTGLPSIVTHNMLGDSEDLILNHLRHRRLINRRDDRVKVVFHPEFITSTNPLFSLDYDEFVRGCHLGVFPSYYEPWGYTPAECTVMGVPSVCSNLSGFGNFMHRHVDDPESHGIYILDRRFVGPDESISQLADMMYRFCRLTRRQRIQMRNRTERLSELLDWRNLGKSYTDARNLALQRTYGTTTT
ncbi:MAG: glycogen/starch synthase [Phycisphaerae bacterium]|nr:glycogen/starch synthase [Phycisphaerae bacterium]